MIFMNAGSQINKDGEGKEKMDDWKILQQGNLVMETDNGHDPEVAM